MKKFSVLRRPATYVRRFLAGAGVLPVAFVAWRAARDWSPALFRNNRRLKLNPTDGLPTPPPGLIFSATATRDLEWFLDSGAQTAASIRSALESIGRPLESFEAVFELGCGCGRVLRKWATVKGPLFHASDYNPRGVAWAKRNLRFVSFSTNELEPPLPYADGAFDLCYAISVFTHLPMHLQIPWLRELHRVLRPGGILLVTLSGEGDIVRLTSEEQRRFANGAIVVVDPEFAGTNMCGVYHSYAAVEKEWSSLFRILRHSPQGALGSPFQDLYVLERQD